MTPQSMILRDRHEIPMAALPPHPGTPVAGTAVAGAVAAFADMDTLLAVHQVRVFRFLMMSLRDRDLAQTMTQETFLRAWKTRESFRGECAPATWLIRIAVNLVRDHTRTDRFRFWKKVAEHAVDVADVSAWLPGQGGSAEASLIQREQLERIWETVATLSGRQREVFMLRFVEELELSEIAAATEMPLSTVKSHLYRAIDHVRAKQTGSAKERR